MSEKIFKVAFCAFLILYPLGSLGFDVGFTTSLDKVFFEEPVGFDGVISKTAEISLAKNEYEAVQMVIFPDDDLSNVAVEVTDLHRMGGSEIIASSDISVNVVGYVNQVESNHGGRLGWYPDPLLPNQVLNLTNGVLQPYLITVHTNESTRGGNYTGNIIIRVNGAIAVTLDLQVKVWNFTLPKVSKFKATSFANWYTISGMWPDNWVPREERRHRYFKVADLAFRNKLPTTAFLANGFDSYTWEDGCVWYGDSGYGYPTHDGEIFNAARIGEFIDYMLEKGANHFFIAFTSNILLPEDKAEARKAALEKYLTDYRSYLSSRGLLDVAYVYNVDEPWAACGYDLVVHAKDIFTFIKNNVGSDVQVMQNTNQNNDQIIGRLLGFFDALDINLGWYNVTNSDYYRSQYPDQLQDFWWNVNIWPFEHPNLFLEYPLIDARIFGPMSYKFNIQGFEYWELFSTWSLGNYYPIPSNELRVNYSVNHRSLDGFLVYPGDNFEVYSSLRFESFRDGIEDMEYLYLLEDKDPTNPLLSVNIVSDIDTFTQSPSELLNFRSEIAELLSEDISDDKDPSNSDGDNSEILDEGRASEASGGCGLVVTDQGKNLLPVLFLIFYLISIFIFDCASKIERKKRDHPNEESNYIDYS